MPNLFAHLVLYSFPVVALILFLNLERNKAIILTIIAGYLLLPNEVELDLPLLPVIDKSLLPALTALVLSVSLKGRRTNSTHEITTVDGKSVTHSISKFGTNTILVLIVVMCAAVFGTILTNQAPVQIGIVFLPALRIYDAFSIILGSLMMIIPYVLGWKYLRTAADHRLLLGLLALAGLLYSLPSLFEVRMSPQLNVWIYGFFPHAFDQHIRAGGFRPLVFLTHGLLLGIYFSVATIACAAMLRRSKLAASNSLIWSLALVWMLIVLVLVKALGALMITLVLLPFVLLASSGTMMRVATTIGVIVLVFPMLRSLGWIPIENISELANNIDPERAASFNFRIANEDVLLERAQEKPFLGWGGYGRNELFDPETGRNIVIIDGVWVAFIGHFGWFGYITRFGLLTFPLFFWMSKELPRPMPYATAGLSLALAANLIDLIPNSGLTPITWLIAGSLTGYVTCRQFRTEQIADTAEITSKHSASQYPLNIRKKRI